MLIYAIAPFDCFILVATTHFQSNNLRVSQIVTVDESNKSGLNGFFESIKRILKTMWHALVDFFTGKTCRYVSSYSHPNWSSI